MEIIQTGDLQRINYEMNNSYLATQIFTNIYGVGVLIKLDHNRYRLKNE